MMEENEKVPLINLEEERSASYSSIESNLSVVFRNSNREEENYLEERIASFQKVTYTWYNLNVYGKIESNRKFFFFKNNSGRNASQKHILKNVNGIAYPGEILAILGASGAGKTTLLNALTFRSNDKLKITGLRCINDIPIDTSLSFTSQSAYVQQNDLFISCLTVREHLIFQALVRMDNHISKDQRINRVDEVIQELGLKGCENNRIGSGGLNRGISGGEMRRLSFASEMLTDPSVMFCDEPTSGLDSCMALNVIQMLKGLTEKGKTIICTVHQPSSDLFSLFDKILLMAEGRVAFNGTLDQAQHFFTQLGAPCPSNFNPADHYVELMAIEPGCEESSKNAINMICDLFEKTEIAQKTTLQAASFMKDDCPRRGADNYNNNKRSVYKSGWWWQTRAVFWRSWLCVVNETILVKVRIMQTILIACVTSIIFYGQQQNENGVNNINGVLYIFLTNITFQNIFAVITVFCAELPIFLRENKNGMYRTDVYFLCKTLAEMPLFTIIPILFTSITYFPIGLNPGVNKFFNTVAILICVVYAVISFGYMISSISNDSNMALALGPPLLVPFSIFGGFLLNIQSIPYYFRWLSYLSWFKYGNEALLINQWDGVDIMCNFNSTTCPKNGKIILEIYNFNEENFHFDFIQLLLLAFAFRILAFLALLRKTYKND